MRLRHRVPVLAIAAAGALVPATAMAADASPAPTAQTAAEKPLVTVSAGLSLNVLGINLTLGASPPPPPTVPGDPTLLGLSVAADVGVNAGALSAQVDANAGATVSQNLGAAVTVDTNVSAPGVVDTGVKLDATVPPLNSGTPPSGSLHIKGVGESTTPASGSTGATQASQRPTAVQSGGGPAPQTPQTPPHISKPPVIEPPVRPAGHPNAKPPRTVRPTHRPAHTSAPLSGTLAPSLRKPADLPPLHSTDLPVATQVIDAVAATGRTLALPLALLAALLAYLGLQRLLDRGPKLAWADGRTPPDDELLEL